MTADIFLNFLTSLLKTTYEHPASSIEDLFRNIRASPYNIGGGGVISEWLMVANQLYISVVHRILNVVCLFPLDFLLAKLTSQFESKYDKQSQLS